MITTFFINILFSFLSTLLGFFPTGSISQSILDSISYLWGIGNSFSYVIPMDTFLQAIVLVMAFEVFVLLWSIVGWIIRKVPGMQS